MRFNNYLPRIKNKLVVPITLLMFIVIAVSTNVYFLFFQNSQGHRISRVNASVDAQSIRESCRKSDKQDYCMAQTMSQYAKNHDLSATLSVLDNLRSQQKEPLFCHLIAHKISIAEVSKDPDNWAEILSKVDINDCTRGFFHGVMEGYSQYHPDFQLTEKTIPSFCSKVADAISTKEDRNNSIQSCLHGIGHMLLVQQNADVKSSIKICSALPEDDQMECFGGVFMENMNRENLQVHQLAPPFPWTPENTLIQEKICKEYTGRPATQCWKNLSNMYVATLGGYDANNLISLCSRAGTQEDRDVCSIEGIGFMAFLTAYHSVSPGVLRGSCNSFSSNNDLYSKCIVLVIEYLLNTSPEYNSRVQVFCSGVTEEKKQFCEEYRQEKLQSLQGTK